jgi:hypothetical protein
MKLVAFKQALAIFGLLVFIFQALVAPVFAGGQKTYYPSGGTDVTGASPAYLSSTDITWVNSVDSNRVTTSDWPDNAYNETKYVEFDFSGNFSLASDAEITSFKITVVYRASATTLAAAKLKVYEKENNLWHEEGIGVPTAANTDTTFTTGDLSSYIDTATDLNNLIVRFYAYDQSTTSTSINQVKADFTYDGTVTGTGGTPGMPAAGSNSGIQIFLLGSLFVLLGFYFRKAKIFSRA